MVICENVNVTDEKYDLSRLSFLAREPRKIMLFIDAEVPQYDVAAGYFIIFEYLKIFLKNGYRILFWPFNRLKIEPYTQEMQQMGIEVIYGDVPFPELMEKAGKYIDISIVCRPEIASSYLDQIAGSSRCKIVYFAHDLHFLRESRQAEVAASEAGMIKACETKAAELDAMRKADISLLLSSKEVLVIKSEDSRIKTAAIPWIQSLNVTDGAGFEERRDIVFLGGFQHSPNIDAVKWLHDDIVPGIRDAGAGIRTIVIGSNIPPEIKDLDGEDFRVLGYVEELGEHLNQARVFIAPLRFGAGIKGKIAMALSYGLPTVTTSIGAEGMGLVDGETALIADDAKQFAEKVIELYTNKVLWEKISANSITHVADNFSPEKAEQTIMGIINGLEISKSRAFIGALRKKIVQRNRKL